MINKISSSSVNNRQPLSQTQNQPQFKGGFESGIGMVLGGVQYLEQNPMMNVAVLDVTTAIGPRTIVEGQTNPYAGFEAFRRESSGLIINCMIPGVIVLGIAKALQGPIMGGKSTMAGSWANEDTIKMVAKYRQEAEAAGAGKTAREISLDTVKRILKNMEGANGKEMVSFDKIEEAKLDSVANKIVDEAERLSNPNAPKGFSWSAIKARRAAKKDSNKAINEAFETIVKETYSTENIRINGFKGKDGVSYFSQGLKSILENTPKILHEITSGKHASIEEFTKKSIKLVNWKGALGLGAVVIPLAIAAQPLNRWLTEKSSGKKGAPIYKDFGDTQNIELSKDEKSALFRQKIISIGSIVGVSLLSMMKLPSMSMLKGLVQFEKLFPTMDQARLVSTATFASRMGASQDKNDLREATVRDIATFSSFYFLGDYVAKGIASLVQKLHPEVELINVLKERKEGANIFQKFGHWAKNTALKSSDELATKKLKNIRAACQLGNIAFSLIALGIVIPKIYRGKTDSEREKELQQKGVDPNQINKYYHHLLKNNPNFASKNNTYNAFFTSK